jgi:MATE family multidrug resistance protein
LLHADHKAHKHKHKPERMGEEGAAAPLLDGKIKINGEGAAGEGEDAAAGSMRWWRGGVWDAEEAAGQVAFAAPMVATSMAF